MLTRTTTLLTLMAVLFAAPPGASPERAGGLAHLPASVREGILAWRGRLEGAGCLKVVCETEQTWEGFDELTGGGAPTVTRRERFESHAWMTPDLLWVAVFPVEDGGAAYGRPVAQVMWERETGLVRERTWVPERGEYRLRRYTERSGFGPSGLDVPGCRGCIHATVLQSWLAGGERVAERCPAVRLLALTRTPNLAVLPPAEGDGVWLDVIREVPERDRRADDARVYRRNDLVRLSRDGEGLPVVSEWRTVVLTDPEDGGRRPTQITGVRRLSYAFFGAPPAALRESVGAFGRDVDEILDAETLGASEGPRARR